MNIVRKLLDKLAALEHEGLKLLIASVVFSLFMLSVIGCFAFPIMAHSDGSTPKMLLAVLYDIVWIIIFLKEL